VDPNAMSRFTTGVWFADARYVRIGERPEDIPRSPMTICGPAPRSDRPSRPSFRQTRMDLLGALG
jgi:hypothetical protein